MNILAMIGVYQIVMWVYKIGKAIARNRPTQSTRSRNELYDEVD